MCHGRKKKEYLCMLPYLPSSMSTTCSGRHTLSVSGSMKTREPMPRPDAAKIKGGRKSQTSSSSMMSGARELPSRQTPPVKPIPHCLHGNKTLTIRCPPFSQTRHCLRPDNWVIPEDSWEEFTCIKKCCGERCLRESLCHHSDAHSNNRVFWNRKAKGLAGKVP